jgi:hypothetical protein
MDIAQHWRLKYPLQQLKIKKNNIGYGLGYSTALKLKVSITATKNKRTCIS